jgi:DNA-binding transcriptional regulator YiaG
MDVVELARSRRSRQPLAPSLARGVRQRAMLTQAELAASLGVTQETVSRWELGLRAPKGETADAYEAILRDLIEAIA